MGTVEITHAPISLAGRSPWHNPHRVLNEHWSLLSMGRWCHHPLPLPTLCLVAVKHTPPVSTGIIPDTPPTAAEGPVLHGRGIFARILQGFRKTQGNSLGPKRTRSGSEEVPLTHPRGFSLAVLSPAGACRGLHPSRHDPGWPAFRSLSAEQRRPPAPCTRDLAHSEPGEGEKMQHSLTGSCWRSVKEQTPLCVF